MTAPLLGPFIGMKMIQISFWTAVKVGLGFTIGAFLAAPLFFGLGMLMFASIGK